MTKLAALDKAASTCGFSSWDALLKSCRAGGIHELPITGLMAQHTDVLLAVVRELPRTGLHFHMTGRGIEIGPEEKFPAEVVAADRAKLKSIEQELDAVIAEVMEIAASGVAPGEDGKEFQVHRASKDYPAAAHDSTTIDHMQATRFVSLAQVSDPNAGVMGCMVVELKGGGYTIALCPPGHVFFRGMNSRAAEEEAGWPEFFASADDAMEAAVEMFSSDGSKVEVLPEDRWWNPLPPLPLIEPRSRKEFRRVEKACQGGTPLEGASIFFLAPALGAAEWGIVRSTEVVGLKTADGGHCVFAAITQHFDPYERETGFLHYCPISEALRFIEVAKAFAVTEGVRPLRLCEPTDEHAQSFNQPLPEGLNQDLLTKVSGFTYPRVLVRPLDRGIPFSYACHLNSPAFLCMVEESETDEDAAVIRARMKAPFVVVRYEHPNKWIFAYNFVSMEGPTRQPDYRAFAELLDLNTRQQTASAFSTTKLQRPPTDIEVHDGRLHIITLDPDRAERELEARGFPLGPMMHADFLHGEMYLLFLGPPLFLLTKIVHGKHLDPARKAARIQGNFWLADPHWFGSYEGRDIAPVAEMMRQAVPMLTQARAFLDGQAPGRGKYPF